MNKKIIFGIVIFFAFAFLLYTFANPLEDDEGNKFLNDDGNNKVNNVDNNSTDNDNSDKPKGIYTIKFNTSGGSSVNSIKTENGKITSLSTPKRDGYKFLGWYSDGKEYIVGSTVSKDITLTAKWEKVDTTTNNPNGTTVNNGANGGTNSGTNGGNQGGSNNGGNNDSGSTVTPPPSIPEYTISFNSNGGNSVSSIKVSNGLITSLPTPKREGYEFLGWYNGDVKYSVGNKITGNITLTAKWNKIVLPEPEKTYIITFISNGGGDFSPIKVTNGKITSLPTPSRSGYNFLGWYNGDVKYSVGNTINGDVTLTAHWEKISSGSQGGTTPTKPNEVSNVTISSNDNAVENITVSSQTPNASKVVTDIRLAGSVNKRETGGYSVNISFEIPDSYEISDVEGKVKVKVLKNEYGINGGTFTPTRNGRYYVLPIGFNNDAVGAKLPLKVEIDWLGTGSPVTYKLYFNGVSFRAN